MLFGVCLIEFLLAKAEEIRAHSCDDQGNEARDNTLDEIGVGAAHIAQDGQEVRRGDDVLGEIGDTSIRTADKATDHQGAETAHVRQADAIEHRLGNAAQDTGYEGAEGVAALRLTFESKSRTEGDAEACPRGEATREHDTGHLASLEERGHHGHHKGQMHTAHDEELPKGGDHADTEESGIHTEPGKAAADGVAHNRTEGGEQAQDERRGDKEAQNGREHG